MHIRCQHEHTIASLCCGDVVELNEYVLATRMQIQSLCGFTVLGTCKLVDSLTRTRSKWGRYPWLRMIPKGM
jgi:hypothetical protein